MVHENIKQKISNIIKLKKSKELDIYVFGLSYLGKLAVKILKGINQTKIKLIDNDEKLWNTTFDNIIIYNPKQLLKKKMIEF